MNAQSSSSDSPILSKLQQLSDKLDSLANLNNKVQELSLQCQTLTNELVKAQETNKSLQQQIEKLSKETPPCFKQTVSQDRQQLQILSECILIGDDTISLANNYLCDGILVHNEEGGTIKDVRNCLQEKYLNGDRFGRVILQVGATDCEDSHNFNITAATAEYKLLIKEACQISNGNVTISSVLPRCDQNDKNVQALNKELYKLAEREKCLFINNDLNFRFINGFPDNAVLDGQLPNDLGIHRLLSNFELPFSKGKSIPVSSSVAKSVPKLTATQSNKSTKPRASLSSSKPTATQPNKPCITKSYTNSPKPQQDFVKVQGHRCKLSNFSQVNGGIVFDGNHFSTTEGCYHYKKAKFHGQSQLADCFQWMDNASDINKMSKMYIKESNDWLGEDGAAETIMYETLQIRAKQDKEFVSELLSTGSKTLLHTVPDKYWGSGSYELPGPNISPEGKNRFGVLLMRLRKELQSHPPNRKVLLPTPCTQPRLPTYSDVLRNNVQNQHQPTCNYCGESGHLQDNCRHNGPVKCYQCGREGHKIKHCSY